MTEITVERVRELLKNFESEVSLEHQYNLKKAAPAMARLILQMDAQIKELSRHSIRRIRKGGVGYGD
jgi:hypothetical protein